MRWCAWQRRSGCSACRPTPTSCSMQATSSIAKLASSRTGCYISKACMLWVCCTHTFCICTCGSSEGHYCHPLRRSYKRDYCYGQDGGGNREGVQQEQICFSCSKHFNGLGVNLQDMFSLSPSRTCTSICRHICVKHLMSTNPQGASAT